MKVPDRGGREARVERARGDAIVVNRDRLRGRSGHSSGGESTRLSEHRNGDYRNEKETEARHEIAPEKCTIP
jgi:hypothetical protein